jgi:site-specific recombinase XerD
VKTKIEVEPLAGWYPLTQQFKLTLKVSGRSPRTTEAYDLAIRELLHYLLKMGLRIGPDDVTAEHLRLFFASLMDHCAPATINQRYRSLNRFFGWIVEEGERTDNPLARIPVPKVPQRNVRALSLDEVRALLKVPDRKTFLGARDHAIILCLVDTGLRAGEFLSMRTSETNPEVIVVIGKGNKERSVRLGEKSQLAVMRYQRMRQKFGIGPGQSLLWVNRWGHPLTRSGLLRVLRSTGRAAGLSGVYTHLMRHTFATLALDGQAPAEAVRVLMGHTSDTMLRRYTRTRDIERALAAHRRFSPGDML